MNINEKYPLNEDKWEYDKMLNYYKNVLSKEYDENRNFIAPTSYRIDPHDGKKYFDYDIPKKFLREEGRTNPVWINLFVKVRDIPKPQKDNYNSNEEFHTAMFMWLDFHVPLSINYWGIRKGKKLELAVQDLLEKMGYEVEHTGKRNDKGIDLKGFRYTGEAPHSSGLTLHKFEEVSIQCKGTAKIGPAVIREAIGVKTVVGGIVAVVCPNGFSQQAIRLANENKILLANQFDLCAAYRGESNPFDKSNLP